jgi:hypothetical protein
MGSTDRVSSPALSGGHGVQSARGRHHETLVKAWQGGSRVYVLVVLSLVAFLLLMALVVAIGLR